MELLISSETNQDAKSYVANQMLAFNLRHFPDELKGRYRVLNLSLRDAEGTIRGGLAGEICWNWLEVHYLYVEEDYRKSGYGRKLLEEAERLAKLSRCDFVKLDTLGFQALDFYKKQGFEVFGTLPNAGGYAHYYLKKDIEKYIEKEIATDIAKDMEKDR